MNGLAYSRRWWTLGVLCLSLLVIVVDTTIVNVALPTFARDLHASGSGFPRQLLEEGHAARRLVRVSH